MEIQQQEDGKKGEFYLEVDGNKQASMTYSYALYHKQPPQNFL